jgi:hypothetical protein
MAIFQEQRSTAHGKHSSATSPDPMDTFINTQLQPVEYCIVCTEPFSATHQPVALPCKHIFGQECIKKWLRSGRGNNSSCPNCRHVIFTKKNPRPVFDTPSIWKALCEQPPERLHTLMTHIWTGLQDLWKQYPSGTFSVTSLLETAILPALLRTSTASPRAHDPLTDCYNLTAGSWESLGRPDLATGLAVPLVRLARLMTGASSALPKWLTTVPRTNRLFWRANACLDLDADNISWNVLSDAAAGNDRYAPLLHLYTMLVSQSIAHSAPRDVAELHRHEVMNCVVERCCVKIGGLRWAGRPSSAFKDVLVGVFEELCRYQLEKGRISLRGHDAEEAIVKGVWAVAAWSKRGRTTTD